MKNWLLVSALLLAATVVSTDAAPAKSWANATIKRDWRDQFGSMNANLNLWLTHRVRLPNGQYRDEQFSCFLRVDVRVSMAQLRAGEVEEFDVEARDYGMSGDDPVVNIQVRPRTGYYNYFQQQHSIVIRSSSAWDNISMYASFRLRQPAPATVDKLSVQLTVPTSPVSFSWRDYGIGDNNGSIAEYRFRVGRVAGVFSPDVVVAEGELGGASTVTLTQGGTYTAGHTEWFQQGQKYRLVIWMRRKNSDAYTEEYGQAEWGTFTFQHGNGILQAPAPANVPLPRQERFDALYSGR